MVMSGSNTYVGPTSVSGGTLQIGNGTSGEALSSGSISVGSGAVLAFNQADTLTISPSGGISGSGGVVKSGSGTLVLGSTNNTYSGGTTIYAGTLKYGAANALPSTGAVNVDGPTAILDLGGSNATIGALTLAGGTLQNGTLNASSYALQNGTVAAILSGGGAVSKSTSGTVFLSAVNSYTGGTTISAGPAAIGQQRRLGRRRPELQRRHARLRCRQPDRPGRRPDAWRHRLYRAQQPVGQRRLYALHRQQRALQPVELSGRQRRLPSARGRPMPLRPTVPRRSRSR